MSWRKLSVVLLLGVTLFSTAGWGQKKLLNFAQTSSRGDNRLLAALPTIEGWLDADHYLEARNDRATATSQLMKVGAADGSSELFIDYTALDEKLPKGFSTSRRADRSQDYQGYLFDRENDLYYFNAHTGRFKRLTESALAEKTPQLSPDGKWVAYTRENDLYACEIESGREIRLTSDGSDVVYNGYASWVYYEEILGRASRYRAFWWSPNGEMIAFLRFDDSQVPLFTLVNADSAHGEVEQARYPKPGDPNPKVRLGVAHLRTTQVVWITRDDADDYVAWPFWTPDSKKLFFQWMNRGQDHLVIQAANPADGTYSSVYAEKQASWVSFFEDLTLLQDGTGFLLRSDKSGWSHLYYYDMRGKLLAQLTSGEWPVKSIVQVDERSRMVYFLGAQGPSTDAHLYCVRLNGKGLTQLTRAPGSHRTQVAPESKYFIDSYSNVAQPGVTELCRTDGRRVRTLGEQKTPELDEYALGETRLFAIPSGDGYDLPARWTLPPDFDPSLKYPVIFDIYGGPDAGTVRNSYTSLSTQYLAQRGIIVLAVDHRGSGHFGKKGAALMHRNLGVWEMHDYIAAVKWLRRQSFVDSSRIGIEGGSYGGYATCMALTAGADYFTHGIAEFSVTDWRLYDSVYTERYMDTPAENPEGYKAGSVMTYADKLKGKLFIVHGTMDDNVHMQNSIQLIDALQDVNKDFQLMIYPNQRHGIRPPKSVHLQHSRMKFWFRELLGKDWRP